MTIYFMGGEMTDFLPSDSTSYETTNAATFNSAFGRCGIRAAAGGGTSNYIWANGFTLPDEFYIHFEGGRGTSSVTSVTMFEARAAGTAVFRILSTDAALQMQRWTGAAWSNVGSSVTASMANRQEIDLYIDGNTGSGTATLYVSGTERATASADLSLVAAVDEIRFYGIDIAAGHYVSQIIAASVPTIGYRLATFYPSGAGATVDWSGTYTDVDETVLSDADFIYSATNGQIELYTGTGPSLTGYVPRAVAVSFRSKRGAAGPANIQAALRTNSTNYFSSSKAQGVGYDCYQGIWETNPDTLGDWSTSQISALQFGVKAVT